MKTVLFDSSAFVKRYIQEDGSARIEQFLQEASQLALCIILVPEIISGLNRRVREQVLSPYDYREVKRQLMKDVHDATVLQVTPSIISRSVKLPENNVLRAIDSLPVACALEWQARLFVTADQRQWQAAKNAGLHAAYSGPPDILRS